MRSLILSAVLFTVFVSRIFAVNYEFVYQEISTSGSTDSLAILAYADSMSSINGKAVVWDFSFLKTGFSNSNKEVKEVYSGSYVAKYSIADTGHYYYYPNQGSYTVMQNSYDGFRSVNSAKVNSYGDVVLPGNNTISNVAYFDSLYSYAYGWGSFSPSTFDTSYFYIRKVRYWFDGKYPVPVVKIIQYERENTNERIATISYLKGVVVSDTTLFCPDFSWKNKVYNTDTTFTDVVQLANNIDSSSYFTFVKNEAHRISIETASCGAYQSPSGKVTWNSTGVYQDTISKGGCDTIYTVDLIVVEGEFTEDSTNFESMPDDYYRCVDQVNFQGSWVNAVGDDQEWWIAKGGYSYALPEGDHTLGAPCGYSCGKMAYLRNGTPTNSTACLLYATSRLLSKCIDLTNSTSAEFSFWYHLHDPEIGSLRIKVSDGEGVSTLFEVSGNQGYYWNNKVVDLNAYLGKSIIIIIEGTTGTNRYMSIDDLVLRRSSIITDTKNNAVKSLVLSPNPSSGKVNFTEIVESYKIYSVDGRLLQVGYEATSANLAPYPPGMYILRMAGQVFKVFKE